MAEIDRNKVVQQIATVLAGDERILALVLIGSGAVGYLDEWSDVDLMAVVADGEDAAAVGTESTARLRDALPIVWVLESFHIPTLRSLLLEGYLEVDLSFVPLPQLRATEPRWRVVFDHTGEVADRMAVVHTVADPVQDALRAYRRAIAALWFGLTALRRGRLLSAAAYVAELRTALAMLFALRQRRPAAVAAFAADGLPDDDREVLTSLTVALDADALEQAFTRGHLALRTLEHDPPNEGITCDDRGLSDWVAAKFGH